jgi:DNA-binding CsgD family transcriptional regulator
VRQLTGRIEAPSRRDEARSLALAELSDALTESISDIGTVLSRVVEVVSRALGDIAVLRLLDDEGAHVHVVAADDAGPHRRDVIRRLLMSAPTDVADLAPFRAAVRQVRPLVLRGDALDDASSMFGPDSRQALDDLSIQTALICPMRALGRVIGTLGLWRRAERGPYTERDQNFAQELADRAALAIENARQVERLRAEHQRHTGPRGRGLAAARRESPLRWTDEFQGRACELDQLRRAFEGLERGEPARLLILGDPGIGKSRLLAEAVSNVWRARVAILSSRALEVDMDRPFGVLVDALDLCADSVDPERAAIGRAVMRARDPAQVEQRHNLVRRIVQFVDSLCDTGPLALLLEDMQWADPLSAITLGATLEALRDRPLGVFMSSRRLPFNPTVDGLLERAGREVERVELDALPSESVNSLVYSLTGGHPGPRLATLVADAGGNPGLVIGLVDALRANRTLIVIGETAETDATEPPLSMHPVVMARVARLSERCQDLLTVAAVLGEPFAVARLAAAADRSVIDVLADLREAMTEGIIAEVDGILCFRHELVRTILYAETPASARSILHLRIGNSLSIAGRDATVVRFHVMRGRSLAGRASKAEPPVDTLANGTLPGWETLTRAEREVVRHVVEGLTNREIGERLFVSARTVETHLAHVFAKLGVSSRVELTGAVIRAEVSGVSRALVGHTSRVTKEGFLARRPPPPLRRAQARHSGGAEIRDSTDVTRRSGT